MHSVNHNSNERDRRLARQANAIKFERKIKQRMLETRATMRIFRRIMLADMAAGIV